MGSPSTSEDRPRCGEGGRRRAERSGRPGFLAASFLLISLLASVAACRRPHPAGSATPGRAQRIVALTPSLTETLFALGLGERVVGVGDFTHWPAEAERRPHVGGLFNPNVEQIAALHPDLAVLMPSERDLAAKLAPLGVETLIVPIETLADVERSFGAVARRCGVPEAGERLRRQWRHGLVAQTLQGPPLRVVLSVGRDPGRLSEVTVAASRTFLDEILVSLGAVNAFADAPTRYPQISLEEIVARQPDLIVELRSEPMPSAAQAALIRDWDELPQLAAVRAGRVIVIAADYTLIPGPRLPLLARDLREVLMRLRPVAQ